MKIPREFELINDLIKVEIDNNLHNKEDYQGWAKYRENKIIIDGSDYFKDEREQTFLHELIHWILFKMENDLHSDEKFVNLFASLLDQALKTMKY